VLSALGTCFCDVQYLLYEDLCPSHHTATWTLGPRFRVTIRATLSLLFVLLFILGVDCCRPFQGRALLPRRVEKSRRPAGRSNCASHLVVVGFFRFRSLADQTGTDHHVLMPQMQVLKHHDAIKASNIRALFAKAMHD
jgi:hypothetical protein